MTTRERAVEAGEAAKWLTEHHYYVQPYIPYPDGRGWASRRYEQTFWLTDEQLIEEACNLGFKGDGE